MTSQIALLNYHGVAVASDSNVSIGKRTFERTKVYQLAGRQPVGIMSCGVASYLDIPLPTLIAEYRDFFAQENPQNAELDYLYEYVASLRKFITTYHGGKLTDSKTLTNEQKDEFEYELRRYLRRSFPSIKSFDSWFDLLRSDDELHDYDWWKFDTDSRISRSLGFDYDEGQTVRKTLLYNIKQNLKDEISKYHNKLKQDYNEKLKDKKSKVNESWESTKKDMSRTYARLVNPIINQFTQIWDLPKTKTIPLLREILYYYLSDEDNIVFPTTITFFGFGKKEIKPCLIKLEIGPWRSGKDCSRISEYNKISTLSEHAAGWTDVEESIPDIEYNGPVSYAHAFMCPIAQSEEISSILGGIHPNVWRSIKYSKKIKDTTKQSILGDMRNRNNSFRRIVQTLPITELATFAETLMTLESSIAYLSRASRGVGGPTTVATITKADGFLWVKSQESVDYNLNPRQQVAPRHSAHLK